MMRNMVYRGNRICSRSMLLIFLLAYAMAFPPMIFTSGWITDAVHSETTARIPITLHSADILASNHARSGDPDLQLADNSRNRFHSNDTNKKFTHYHAFDTSNTSTVKKLLTGLFHVVLYPFTSSEAFAQTAPDPANYTTNRIPWNFVDISTTGTLLFPALTDESGISGIPIGFDFDFFGNTYTTLTGTSNGYITFSNLISPDNTPIPSTPTPNNIIAPFWDDLNPEANPGSAVYYETLGTAPNRHFIVEWKDYPLQLDSDSRLTFEVILFEGSNEIQIQYSSMVDGNGVQDTRLVSGALATIGIEDSVGGNGNEVAYKQEGTATGGSAFSFTLSGNAFEDGRRLGDLDGDGVITVLDQSLFTDMYVAVNDIKPSMDLLLSDIAPLPGTGGRPFGDGGIDGQDNTRFTDAFMGRTDLNPTISRASYVIAPVGESLTVYGSRFDTTASNNNVTFVDVEGNDVTVSADSVNAGGTELTVTVPGGAKVTSLYVEHSGLSSNSQEFALEGVPVIIDMVESGGEAGDIVVVRGYEFELNPGDNIVDFNGVTGTVTSVRITGYTYELVVTVPVGVGTGPVTVAAGGLTSNGTSFTLDGPPMVAINTPGEGDKVTDQIDIIGTASDIKLVNYELEYAPVDGSFTTFAMSSSSVTNGILGKLDPTLLLNGLYKIRLTAVDESGNIRSTTRNIQITGANKPGVFTMAFTDLQIPVSGIPITVTRSYDSRVKSNEDFGIGWDLDISQGSYINNRTPGEGWEILNGGLFGIQPCIVANETLSHVTEIRLSEQESYVFRLTIFNTAAQGGGCSGTAGFAFVDGTYPGATLQILGNTSIFKLTGFFQILDYEGSIVGFIYNPQQVRLTTFDGRVFDLDMTNGITRIEDRNGNELFLNASGVIHSSGKSVSFTRDSQNRITQITDPTGQTLNYTYDSNGDLTSFSDRAGNATTFTYDSNHYLLEIHDPLGNIPLRNEYDSSGRLTAQIDADGNRSELTYDLANNKTTVLDRLGQTSIIEYNSEGKITKTVTDSGDITTSTYDSNGNQTSETDPLVNTRTFTYDANNNLLSETDALGNTTSYTYNASGQLTSMSDPRGNNTAFAYDADGNLLSLKDTNGIVTNQFAYDSSGNVTQATTLGGTTDLAYDSSGNLTRVQGPGGRDVSYTYDANGNRLSETHVRTTSGGVVNETTDFTYNSNGQVLTVTEPLGNTTSFTYNANKQLLTTTNARGNTTSLQYDTQGNLNRKTYPDGIFESFAYNKVNRLAAFSDRAGRITSFEFDDQNRPTRTVFPDGSDVISTYDAAGNLVGSQDNIGNVISFIHDAARRTTRITDPLGNQTDYAYDTTGVMLSSTGPLGDLTSFAYDESVFGALRKNKVTFSDSNTRSKNYGISGRISDVTDELGDSTSFEYDSAGNLTKVTDSLGNETTYTYDEQGNQLTQTDANLNVTSFEYDAYGRKTKTTLPSGLFETKSYDAAGNLAGKTDFNGDTTAYDYDSMDRLILKTLPGSVTIAWAYTPTGKVENITDSRGVTTYSYDIMDRVTGIDNPDGTTIAYQYDAVGNRTSVQSSAGTTTYAYDTLGRLETVTDPYGGVTTYNYDAAGNKVGTVYPNGTETDYSYDSRDRLTSVAHAVSIGGATLEQFDYVLNAAGARTKVTESTSSRIVDYAYDVLHRLTREDDGTAIITYTYDAVGNRLTRGLENYAYDANNRLLTAGTKTFTYDNNGNMLSLTDGLVALFSYNSENQLIQHTAPDGVVTTLTYDAAGNRISRDVGGSVLNFIVDPLDNSSYSQVLAEWDNTTGNILVGYVYGDDLLSIMQGSSSSYYHYDGLGSTRLLTDSSGSISDTYIYDAFGNLTGSTGTTSNNYLFAGEQLDTNLGLYYLRARYMDPATGRFISRDPFSGGSYDPFSLHKYTYASNDPVNKIDPSGLFSLGGMSMAMSISVSLQTMSIPYLGGNVGDVKNNIETVINDLESLKKLKLNVRGKIDELGFSPFNAALAFYEKEGNVTDAITRSVYLGDGAVEFAYGVSEALGGGVFAKIINALWRQNASRWMKILPRNRILTTHRIDEFIKKLDATFIPPEVNLDIPGGYLKCGYNEYIFRLYGFKAINSFFSGAKIGKLSSFFTGLGVASSYTNFLVLIAETGDDLMFNTVPDQPASGQCGF